MDDALRDLTIATYQDTGSIRKTAATLKLGYKKTCKILHDAGVDIKKSRAEALDITMEKFGLLTALERETKIRPGEKIYRWLCLCECGRKVYVRLDMLKSGHTRSCGQCQRDPTGRIYGSLMAIKSTGEFIKYGSRQSEVWRFSCTCGNTIDLPLSAVTPKKARRTCGNCMGAGVCNRP